MPALLDLLCPSRCDGCGQRAAPPWCDECDRARRRPARPCPRCAGDLDGRHGCWEGPPPVDAVVTLGDWTGPLASCVYAAKASGRVEVLEAVGERLGRRVRRVAPVPLDGAVVVPVATDRRRARRRGADHAVALARGVGSGSGLGVQRLLSPVGRQPDRTGRSGRSARAATPPTGARQRLLGEVPDRVVLVDDVVTTGATLASACALLRDAGAHQIVAAVVGRAGARPLGGSSAMAPHTPAR